MIGGNDMKKRYSLAIILIIFVLFTGCSENGEDTSKKNNNVLENQNEVVEQNTSPEITSEAKEFSDPSLNHYEIVAELDTENDLIIAEQKITYTNNEGLDLDEVYLHLYPNAFKKGNHPSLFDTELDEIDQQYGYVEIKSLTINGEVVEHNLTPIDTTLKIAYNFVDGETYDISLDYTVGISTTSERFGVVEDIYNLGNWYPVLSVYDEDGWNLDPYYSIGDPFYSDVSNYDVKITVPKDYEVAASGYLYDVQNDGELTVHSFRADRMRDFAFVIGENFRVISELVNDTMVYLYYPISIEDHKWLDDSLEFGSNSIRFFSDMIGMYPYDNYSVVFTTFPSGMEYPGLVFISTGYLDGFNINNLRNVIVHETAHQWFYSIIGDDEIEDGWIDEGLTSYFTAFYDMKEFREGYYYDTMKAYERRVEGMGFNEVKILKSAKDFSNWTEYGAAAYSKPALMYHQLFMDFGEASILEFAQLLYNEFKFDILKVEDLKETMVTVYGEEITKFINTWLN